MANAGRVAIVPKGDYSSSNSYKRLDLVRYDEKSYVAKKESSGIEPTNTEYWMLMTSDGVVIDSALSDKSTNPLQNKVVKSALDNIQTTAKATLSQAGWYRVARCERSYGNAVLLGIKNIYASSGCVSQVLLFNTAYKNESIVPISLASKNTQTITKARYTTDGTFNYLEVYYTLNEGNPFGFTVTELTHNVSTDMSDSFPWQTITPTLTSETVDGVTVTTTYDIPANASPVTDLDIAEAMNNYKYPNYSANTEEEFYTILSELHTNAMLNSEYKAVVVANVTITKLGTAGVFQLHGFKAHKDTFGWQRVSGYNPSVMFAERILYSGTWMDWDIFATTADLANYFPISGGTVKTSSAEGVTIERQSSAEYMQARIGFRRTDVYYGGLGFSSVDNPLFITTSGVEKKLHHDGNSAKVVVSASAPSDTSALWVDNSNKVVKSYIDGAWTQVG